MALEKETDNHIEKNESVFIENKKIPKIIEQQVLTALSHYPELRNATITFAFTRKLKKSIMAARPVVNTLLGKRENRAYIILISAVFKLNNSIEPIHHVSDEVMVGWIGHELGHIMDYEQRSTLGIARFGVLYGLSRAYIRKAERVADTFAVNRGMAPYLIATKEFILHHVELSDHYKNKIKQLYPSPDDIVDLAHELERSTATESEELLKKEAEISEHIQSDS